jgi:hypothetical protein
MRSILRDHVSVTPLRLCRYITDNLASQHSSMSMAKPKQKTKPSSKSRVEEINMDCGCGYLINDFGECGSCGRAVDVKELGSPSFYGQLTQNIPSADDGDPVQNTAPAGDDGDDGTSEFAV